MTDRSTQLSARPPRAAAGSGPVAAAALMAFALPVWSPPVFAEEAEKGGRESVGDTVSRILLRAVDAPFRRRATNSKVCNAPTSDPPISESVLEAFAGSLDDAWSRPVGGGADATPTVMLELCLGETGRSLSSPFLVEPSGSLEPLQAEALIKALEAVEKVAPLDPQPQEAERWRRILVLFDPLSGSQPKK